MEVNTEVYLGVWPPNSRSLSAADLHTVASSSLATSGIAVPESGTLSGNGGPVELTASAATVSCSSSLPCMAKMYNTEAEEPGQAYGAYTEWTDTYEYGNGTVSLAGPWSATTFLNNVTRSSAVSSLMGAFWPSKGAAKAAVVAEAAPEQLAHSHELTISSGDMLQPQSEREQRLFPAIYRLFSRRYGKKMLQGSCPGGGATEQTPLQQLSDVQHLDQHPRLLDAKSDSGAVPPRAGVAPEKVQAQFEGATAAVAAPLLLMLALEGTSDLPSEETVRNIIALQQKRAADGMAAVAAAKSIAAAERLGLGPWAAHSSGRGGGILEKCADIVRGCADAFTTVMVRTVNLTVTSVALVGVMLPVLPVILLSGGGVVAGMWALSAVRGTMGLLRWGRPSPPPDLHTVG